MTRDEILAMEAGRELDALVAEKVMGYECRSVPANSIPHLFSEKLRFPRANGWTFHARGEDCPAYWLPGHMNDIFVYTYESGYEATIDLLPYYSEDIAAAWEVLEKLMGSGVGLPQVFHDGQLWVASISDGTQKRGNFASAPATPLAISRAALLAVMEAEA